MQLMLRYKTELKSNLLTVVLFDVFELISQHENIIGYSAALPRAILVRFASFTTQRR